MTKSMTALYVIGAFVLGAVVALGGEHLLFKQKDQRDNMETVGAFDGWRLNCPPRTMKNAGCIMQQALARKGSNTVIAQLNIATKDNADTLTIVTPLGVLVPPGLKVSVGSAEKMVSYKTCLQMGCIASVPVDAGLASALSQSAGLEVTVMTPDQRTLPLNFSLQGYRDALAARAVDMAARK